MMPIMVVCPVRLRVLDEIRSRLVDTILMSAMAGFADDQLVDRALSRMRHADDARHG